MQLMTAQECADYLKLSRQQIYQLKTAHRIPFMKVGASVRFDQAKIDEWLNQSSTEAKKKGE